VNAAAKSIDFFAAEVLADPFAAYRQALIESPVYAVPGTGVTMVLSYALVAEAAARVEDFSNDFGVILAGTRSADPEVAAVLDKGWPMRDTLLTADPPDHTRFRKLVNLAFSMKRVDALEAHVRAIVTALIDGFIDRGSCDFVAEFAMPLPVQLITEQIGIDRTDFATVKRWSDAFADRLGGMISHERELECAADVVEFQHAMKARIDERRAAPRDDLLSDLVNAQVDGERPLDDAELLSILQQLMVAGNETTTSALAGGLVQLIRHPDQAEKVRANPALIRNMVEEVLRTESPTAGLWRVVRHDTELGGVPLKAGSMLMLRFAAANRDPARFENPDLFDVERRNANSHIAFGRGIHMCVGNMLSRKEMAVAFDELLKRLDRIAIPDEAALTYPPNRLLRGLSALPISFGARV
jgi:cytochrome P450